MAGDAGPRPPVEGTRLDVRASGALENWGVSVGAVIDDAHPAARTKDSDGFVKRLGAFFAARDVAEGQVAEYDVEGPGRKGQVPCISVDQLDALADALDIRVCAGRLPGYYPSAHADARYRLRSHGPGGGGGRAS